MKPKSVAQAIWDLSQIVVRDIHEEAKRTMSPQEYQEFLYEIAIDEDGQPLNPPY